MTDVERAAAAGELVDVTIERGQLVISPIRRSPSDDAEALKSRLYAMLPRVRITDLLVEVAAWSGFADQRRRTGSILNKGEARNALARAIFFNRLSELRDRTFDNQRHRASGLTLLTAAVTLWNTVYLDRAVRHLRSSGVEVPNELLAHVAPLGWEHIGLTRDYIWSEMDKPRERFRPLRLHQTSRDALAYVSEHPHRPPSRCVSALPT